MRKIITMISLASGIAILSAQTGKVGINTSTPTNTLTVNGNQSIGSGYTGIVAPTNGMIIQGSTAIGTSAPFFGSLLELNSTGKGLRLPQIPLAVTTFWAPLSGSPANTASYGMTVYNTNPDIQTGSPSYPAKGVGEYYWDGTGWVSKNSTIGAQSSEVYFSVKKDSYQSMPDNVWTLIDFTDKSFPKANDFDLTTDHIVIPTNGQGLYQVNASYITNYLPATGHGGRIGVFVNGTLQRTLAIGNSSSGSSMEVEGTVAIYVLAGNTVDFRYLAVGDQSVMPTIDFYQVSR